MKRNDEGKVYTFSKYVSIVKRMKETGDFTLDILQFDCDEISFIKAMVEREPIYNFCEEFCDIDVRELKAMMDYLDYQEKAEKAIKCLQSLRESEVR